MTKKNNAPIKLWMEANELRIISNKRGELQAMFEWLDYKGLGRINTLELFAVILVSIEGHIETIVQNIMLFFGFQSMQEFYRDELHFFFDCLFRGLCNLVITKGSRMPEHRGKYVSHCEIVKLVKKVFGDKTESYERSQFFVHYIDNKAVKETFQHFSTKFWADLKFAKTRNFDRLQYRIVLRQLFLKMKNEAIAIGEKRANERAEGKEVGPIMEESRKIAEILAAPSQQ